MNLVTSRVCFNSEAHTYTLDGKNLSGITGLIDRRIFGGKYAKVDRSFLQPYADYGTLVHGELDAYFTAGVTPENEDAQAFVSWFDMFMQGVQTHAEYTVSDETHFATNIDLVTNSLDGAVDLFDYKTSKELDIERIRWQLSISAYLFELQNGIAPSGLFAAHLRDGACRIIPIEPIEREKVVELLEAERGHLQTTHDTQSIEALVSIEHALIALQTKAKQLETLKADVLARIEAEMERTGTKKIDTERLMITRVLPTTSERLDTKKLEAENADLCKRYMVSTTKKGYIKLTIKKQTDGNLPCTDEPVLT